MTETTLLTHAQQLFIIAYEWKTIIFLCSIIVYLFKDKFKDKTKILEKVQDLPETLSKLTKDLDKRLDKKLVKFAKERNEDRAEFHKVATDVAVISKQLEVLPNILDNMNSMNNRLSVLEAINQNLHALKRSSAFEKRVDRTLRKHSRMQNLNRSI